MKAVLVLALAAAAALALSACGGGDGSASSTGPVTLDQRVVTKEDAPDFDADPVEKPQTVSGPDEFISRLGERFFRYLQAAGQLDSVAALLTEVGIYRVLGSAS